MTSNANFFFEHAFEIRLAVALGGIALGFVLTGLFSSIGNVLTRLAGSAGSVRDGLTAVRPSPLATR